MGKAALLGRVPTINLSSHCAIDGGTGARTPVRNRYTSSGALSPSKTGVKRPYGPPYGASIHTPPPALTATRPRRPLPACNRETPDLQV